MHAIATAWLLVAFSTSAQQPLAVEKFQKQSDCTQVLYRLKAEAAKHGSNVKASCIQSPTR